MNQDKAIMGKLEQPINATEVYHKEGNFDDENTKLESWVAISLDDPDYAYQFNTYNRKLGKKGTATKRPVSEIKLKKYNKITEDQITSGFLPPQITVN